MDDYASIKDGLETMDDGTLLAVKDKLEALKYDEIEYDALPVRWRVVTMCHTVIAERTMTTMRQKVAAIVDEHNLSVRKRPFFKDLTVTKRIEIITSIIEDGCRALLRPDYEPFTMTFEELVDAKESECERRFITTGRNPLYNSFYGMEHFVCIMTSPAGTTFTVDSHELRYPMLESACAGNGKRAKKLSIANIKAIVAAATEGVTLANPPDHKAVAAAATEGVTLANPPDHKEP